MFKEPGVTAQAPGARLEVGLKVFRAGSNLLAVAAVAITAAILTACGSKEPRQAELRELLLLNWEEYYDQSVLDDFRAETGISVAVEEYGQSTECIARFEADPGRYDVVISDGPTMSFLIQARMLAELDKSKMPRFRHIAPEFRDLDFDPGNRFTVPYAYGTTGLAYNNKLVSRPITSWRDLLDPALAGKIALFSDPYESMTCLLLASGHPVNSVTPEALADAEMMAVKLRENGVQLVDYFTIQQRLIAGELVVAMAYGGDLLKAIPDHSEILYVIPDEGSNRWVDSYAVSRYSRHIEAAHRFLDFAMEPAIAARISESQFYPTPNRDAVALTDPLVLSNPLVYPPAEVLDRCVFLTDVGELSSEYLRIYSILAGAPTH